MRATYAALEREKRFDAAAMTGAVYYNIGLYFSRSQDVQKSVGAYRQALAYDRAQLNPLFNLPQKSGDGLLRIKKSRACTVLKRQFLI